MTEEDKLMESIAKLGMEEGTKDLSFDERKKICIERLSFADKFKILEEKVKEGLIGEEIAVGLFGKRKAKELLSKITKH